MQAIRYSEKGPPTVLHLETIDVPHPGPGEVLIQVVYAGVNPVDCHIRGTSHPLLKVNFPATPGKDGAGIIHALGEGVDKFKVGDRVFVSDHDFKSAGTYAQFHVARVDEVHPLPNNYTFQEGAALGSPYFTAIKAIFMAGKGRPGDRILIHGASGQVGLACVQIGVAHGFKVFGTGGTPEGLQRVLKNGAVAVFDHREKNYTDKIKETLGPQGVDIIIEMAAGNNLEKDLELIGRKGRIVVVGTKGIIPVNPTMIMAKEAIVTGVRLASSQPEEWDLMNNISADGIAKGIMRPVIAKEYPLALAAQAHHDLETSSGSQGKLLLRI